MKENVAFYQSKYCLHDPAYSLLLQRSNVKIKWPFLRSFARFCFTKQRIFVGAQIISVTIEVKGNDHKAVISTLCRYFIHFFTIVLCILKICGVLQKLLFLVTPRKIYVITNHCRSFMTLFVFRLPRTNAIKLER